MLFVGDRVVLRASAPPDAEYALFEIADIELRASEPGRVREHGYQTTAGRARARLAQIGVTTALARECAIAMHPALSTAYARGTSVRRVSRYLGPIELFQSDVYDGAAQTYGGLFLDLPTLATDLGLKWSGTAMQALYLAMILETEPAETTVLLSTEAWTRGRKPGERTHKRPNLGAVRVLASSLGELAAKGPRPEVREQLARADVIAFLRARADSAPDDDARALYSSLERSVSEREMPDRGPLADPELWGIETRIDNGQLEGLLEAVESAEQTRGRTPGTTYLRARVSLTLRLEPPKLIAERVSALALSMTSFQELCLLAAEAWLDAGDPRRAMPYARDLVDAPSVDEGLLLRAQRIFARAVGAAPGKTVTHADSLPASPMPPSQPPARLSSIPPVSAPDPNLPRSWPPEKNRVPTARGAGELQRPSTHPGLGDALPPAEPPRRVTRDRISLPPLELEPPPLPVPPPTAAPPPPPLPPASPPPPSRRPLPPPLSPPSAGPKPARASAGPRQSGGLPPDRGQSDGLPPDRGQSRSRRPPERTSVVPSAPPPLELDLTPPPPRSPPPPPPRRSPPPQEPSAFTGPPAAEEARTSRRAPVRRMSGVMIETRARPSFDPRAEPESDEDVRSARPPAGSTSPRGGPIQGRPVSQGPARRTTGDALPRPPALPREEYVGPKPSRPPRESRPPAASRPPGQSRPPGRVSSDAHERPTPMRPPSIAPGGRAGSRPPAPQGRAAEALHGASLPPFRLENPPPLLPTAPLFPKSGGASDELLEHLSLPPGLGQEPRLLDALPKSVLEARVAFTLMTRELGLDYRLKRGIELRADVSGIEAMQAVLLESFPDHTIRTPDDAYEIRRHGAVLGEILARRLDAEWVDISPNELGYWAMIVPPDTRVWPFGRIARFVELGHKERDLVSYFFELTGRARGR